MEQLMVRQKDFISKMELKFGVLEHSIATINNTVVTFGNQLWMVEMQVGQLVNDQSKLQKRVQLPSKGEANPQAHQCHAIEVRYKAFEEYEALIIKRLKI